VPSRRELGVAAALGLFASPAAGAQISPGPLSRAHAELEGVTKCLQCHGIGEPKLDGRCLACHREIAWLREQGRGLHAARDLGECASCHREHGGADFEIVHWGSGGAEAFHHARAGWPLDGRHGAVRCRDCHRAELRTSEVTGMRDGGLPASTWLGLETDCASCHADPHVPTLGADCAQCHVTRGFAEIQPGRFDHDRTGYPLRGAHAKVSCNGCHRTGPEWTGRPESSRCASCHADPHAGLATIAGRPADCASCHSVEGFRPSTFTVAMHATAPYPLEGRHRAVACAACHPAGKTGTVLRRAHSRCTDCHSDPHGGQLATRKDAGACEACHRVDGFSPSTFSAADHGKLGFPLLDRHAETECRSCHGPRRGLPWAGKTPVGTAGAVFRFAGSECRTCHVDPHDGRLAAAGCASCHDARTFSPSRVDAAMHASWSFPLEGAHAAVPCLECHRELDRVPLAHTVLGARPAAHLRFEIEHRECRDCHRDPHGRQFAGRRGGDACSVCHGLDAFVPATRFDHARDAGFELAGAHAAVACAGCHPTAGAGGPRYRPVPRRCEDCHGGASP